MNTQDTISAQTITDSIDPTGLIAQLNSFGFDAGLAVATEAEIQASAACGQMSLVNESYSMDNGPLTQEQIQTIEQNSSASSTPDNKFTQRLF